MKNNEIDCYVYIKNLNKMLHIIKKHHEKNNLTIAVYTIS